jgi:hypothetical protein
MTDLRGSANFFIPNSSEGPMPVNLVGSVGSGGTNTQTEVRRIQALLNCVPSTAGGPAPALTEDGLIGNKTINAIKAFQTKHGLVVDGRIDPGQATLAKLNSFEILTFTFWLNAFIPGTIAGLTTPVPSHAGLTMIHGPIPGVSDCFHTDQRDFSQDINASARLHSEVTVDFSGPTPGLAGIHHKCSPTIECDCEDGDEECNKAADTSEMSFTLLSGTSVHSASLKLVGAAHNGCVPGSPAIDYTGTIAVRTDARSLEFDGFVDVFPAFEAYARINDGSPTRLFAILPKPGTDPWNLIENPLEPNGGNRKIHVRLTDGDADGVFEIVEVIAQP